MKKFSSIYHNIFFYLTLFLLAFIPLYPKKPLVDIVNTWVYIRLEDFVVLLSIMIWVVFLLKKKVTLKTPLTLPILLFWILGGISTIHGVLLIFPTQSDVFANVAFLSLARRIEYMFLFFIAYSSMRDKKLIQYVAMILPVILLFVASYGFGQKYLGFPAYLTMNEEFAKGVPIQLSPLSRVPSTFGGHYDLAAYLVLVIPMLVSLVFGFRNFLMKSILLLSAGMGFVLLFMTVSRVSFFVLLLSLFVLLFFQKKRWVVVSLPILLISSLLLFSFSPTLLNRFGSTVSEVDVLVDAKTGNPIGQAKEVSSGYFKDKVVVRQMVSAEDIKKGSTSIIVPFSLLPQQATLVIEPNSPNGENLPQGTSYINLPLSPVKKRVGEYFYQKSEEKIGTKAAEVRVLYGDFLIKKAKAYDLSFTTRFQGEWPRTLKAFARNIFLGSGYGSVSLAVDNDYLRLLGESGLFGFSAFLAIFFIAVIYIKKVLPKVDSPVAKSFILGFVAGTFGLALNAVLIDVFEASKIAFTYWLLMGIVIGVLRLYQDQHIDLYGELMKMISSPFTVLFLLFTIGFSLFSSITNYYFVGDDFTWFRWVVDCNNCQPLSKITHFITQSDGFFYRPGTKIYFDFMYSAFWLNQPTYHLVSLILHFSVAMLLFLISKRILKSQMLSFFASFLFLIISGHAEMILWIAATGHLFNAFFILVSLLSFIYWKERKQTFYLVGSLFSFIFSLLFHELGLVTPFLIMIYDMLYGERQVVNNISKRTYSLLFAIPVFPYLLVRLFSHSHWFNGDYSYNLFKLPFNALGNAIGYFMLIVLGPSTLSIYERVRVIFKNHIPVGLLAGLIFLFVFAAFYKWLRSALNDQDRKIVVFGFLFFIVALLPFLGLGNITSRYSYLASFGIILIGIWFICKVYEYLLSNGKNTAFAVIALLAIIFTSLHLFQLQKIETDWNRAGQKSKNFLNSLDWVYAHYPASETQQLYFVDIPIKSGDAWIFPVGLSDAVWLVFRNSSTQVYQIESVGQAFQLLGTSTTGKVFKFDDSGSLVEMIKTDSGEIVSVKR